MSDITTQSCLVVPLVAACALAMIRNLDNVESTSILRNPTGLNVLGYVLLLIAGGLVLDVDEIDWSNGLILAILVYHVYTLLSVCWAEDRWQGLKTLGRMAIVVGISFALATGFAPGQSLFFMTMACSGNLLIAAVEDLSSRSTRTAGYRFSGRCLPFVQALNTVLVGFSFAHFLVNGSVGGGVFAAALASSLALLVLTRTLSAICAAIVSILVWALLYPDASPMMVAGIVACCMLAVALALVAARLPTARPRLVKLVTQGRPMSAYGRWSVLSGRHIIWERAWRGVLARPLTGYGFNCFWTPRRVADVSRRLRHRRTGCSAHSAYLEVLLNGGIPGLVLFVAMLSAALYQGLTADSVDRAFFSAVLTFFILVNLADSYLTLPGYESFWFYFVLFTLAAGL